MSDVVLLSLGTTLGWRVSDSLFVDQLRRAGVGVEPVSVRVGASGRLRRAYPVTDLVEAAAARRALAAALDAPLAPSRGDLDDHGRDARRHARPARTPCAWTRRPASTAPAR